MKIRFLFVILFCSLLQLTAFGQGAVLQAVRQLNGLSKDTLTSNPKQALKYAASALQSAQNHHLSEGEMEAHINLGNYYQSVGPYNKAIEHFEHALKIAQSGQDSTKISNIWFKIGSSYHRSNDMGRAIQIFAKVFEYNIKDTTNLAYRSKIMTELARQLYNLEQYNKSLQYFRLALEMQKQLKNKRELGIAYNNVASVYRHLKRYDKASFYLEKGEKIIDERQFPRERAVLYLNQAEVLSDTEEYNEAQVLFHKSLRLARLHQQADLESLALLEQAQMNFKQKKYLKSIHDAQKSLVIAKELNWLLGRKRIYKFLATAYENTKQAQKALNAHKKYVSLRDSLKNIENETTINGLWVRYETQAKITENKLLKEQSERNTRLLKRTENQNSILIVVTVLVVVLVILLYFSNASSQNNNRNLEVQKTELHEAYLNIELLSGIGRTVMAELSVEKIADTLYQRVNMLMEASVFGVALYRPEENTLYFEGVKEEGETLPPFSQDVSENHRHFAVWAFKNNKEVIINDLLLDYSKYGVKIISLTSEQVSSEELTKIEAPMSLIYLPLLNQEKPIGVITVQSFKRNAYSEHHLNVLKNLANYVSIALINATAYDKITTQKDEIDAQNTQLEWQKSVLDAQNKILESQKAELDERNSELQAQQDELHNTLHNLQNAQSQLVQSEKLSSLGQLTAGVAHEINNSINFVYAGIDVLQEHLSEIMEVVNKYDDITSDNFEAKMQEINKLRDKLMYNETKDEIFSLVEDIAYGAERTTEIVKGLRTFSRLDEKELKATDLHQNIDATLIILKNQYKNHIKLTKNYSPDFPHVECYPGKVNQVFMNIINNAIQSIEIKGEIEISTQLVTDLELINPDLIPTLLPLPFAQVTIRDTGKGMTEETKEHIFEPFFTTKSVGKGTGLGLHISMEIIQKHHGKIIVESQEGEGTTFRVYLPLLQPKKTP